MTVLEEIIIHKRAEVALTKSQQSVSELEKSNAFTRKVIPLTTYLTDPLKTGIIAEFKRKSPSKGIINADVTLEEVTTGYFRAGASGLSVLTDEKYFGGTAADLIRAREINPIPILRKDFIIDEFQIIESRSLGADVILLIAAALSVNETKTFARLAKSLDLQVLLEIHDATELGHLNEYIDMVGVNNRDLKTFTVDVEQSVHLSTLLPADFLKISESGIHSALTIKKLRGCGFQGFLMGEYFMKAASPARAFSDFVESIMPA